MNKKKTIGIDLDTTLNNLNQVWINKYNEDYNDNLTEFKNWNVEKSVKKECGKKIFNYLKEPKFFYNLDINQGAKDVIKYLSEHYELYIVTAYFAESCVDKKNWVEKHLPFFDIKNLIFCNNKGKIDLDYLIDDGPHNILDFKHKGIIYDMAYNQDLDDDSIYARVKNWEEIKNLFEYEILRDKVANTVNEIIIKKKKNERICMHNVRL